MTDAPPPAPARSGFSPVADVRLALAFLTRLPMGAFTDSRPLGAAAWAFPVAGAAVGLVGAGVLFAAAWAQLHPLACALLGLTAMVLASGALHEDGLADVADGFGGATDKARKLDIMRDSRIGSYGVLALVFSVGLRAALLAGLHGSGTAALALLAAATGARGVMPALMAALPHARGDGLSVGAGRPGTFGVLIALILGFGTTAAIAYQVLGPNAATGAVVGGALGALIVGVIAKRQIGGQTGDVIGAAGQMAEIGILIGLAGSRWTHL